LHTVQAQVLQTTSGSAHPDDGRYRKHL